MSPAQHEAYEAVSRAIDELTCSREETKKCLRKLQEQIKHLERVREGLLEPLPLFDSPSSDATTVGRTSL